VIQIPEGASTDKGVLASVFMGLAISPDNNKLYVSGGQENLIYIFDLKTGEKEGYISCDDSLNNQGYIGDMILSSDGKYLFAVDQANFMLKVLNTQTKKIVGQAETGIYPFGIVLSPDEKNLFVVNAGVFKYSKVYKKENDSLKETLLDFPAYAYNSELSRKGIDNDTLFVPPLGNPNSPDAFSVWRYDVSNMKNPELVSKIKTGIPVGQKIEGIPAVGGSSPNSLAIYGNYLFVSNATNDNISVIDINRDSVINTIHLTLDKRIDRYRGKIPFGLAV